MNPAIPERLDLVLVSILDLLRVIARRCDGAVVTMNFDHSDDRTGWQRL